ncbi:hypothetical protein GQ607_002379 [Colletotrichum asianum]|uniref:Uncharacterized protein n=1 Tax=Colletotrichum asianum TaxID=702518 RepID=A0A8H3WPQ0_9PEZI|nr:hypothetical protein GQ607_002379 [Colletotrichum asianum]
MNDSVMIPKGVNDGHKGPSVNGRNPSYTRPPLAACFRCIYLISSTGDRTHIHCDAGSRRNDIRSPWSCSHCRSVQVSCGHVPDGYYDISQYLLKTHENYWSLTESQRSNFRGSAVQVMDLFNKLVPPMSHLESLTRATQPQNRRNLNVEASRTLDDRAILDMVVVGLAQNTSALQELMVQLQMMNHQKDRLTSQQTHRPAEPQDDRQPTQISVANPTNGPATQMSGHQSRLSGISRSYAARIAERSQQTDLRNISPPHQNLSGSVVSSSAHTNTGTHPSSSTDKNPHGASAQTTSNGLAIPAPTRAALKSSFTPINRKSTELRARSAAAPSRTSKFSQPDSKRPREADVAATVPKRLNALQPSVNILSKGQQKAVSTAKDFQLATEAFARAQAAIQTPETCVARATQPSPRILGPTISKTLPLHGQPEIQNLIRPQEHSGNHTAQIPSVPTEVASLPHVGLEHNVMSRSYMYSLPSIKQSSAPLHQARVTLPPFWINDLTRTSTLHRATGVPRFESVK